MLSAEKAPPAAAVAELKTYLRIEDGREDAMLAGLLRAATETVEAMLGVLLFAREVEERVVACAGAVRLGAEPARALLAVGLVAPDGNVTTLTEGFHFRAGRHGSGRVELTGVAAGCELVVRYRAGLADDWNLVPEVLRLTVIRAAAHFFAHRDAPDDPGLPPAVQRMLRPWRARRLN